MAFPCPFRGLIERAAVPDLASTFGLSDAVPARKQGREPAAFPCRCRRKAVRSRAGIGSTQPPDRRFGRPATEKRNRTTLTGPVSSFNVTTGHRPPGLRLPARQGRHARSVADLSGIALLDPAYGNRNTDRQLVERGEEMGVKQPASQAILAPLGQIASTRGTLRAKWRQPDMSPRRIRTRTRRRQ